MHGLCEIGGGVEPAASVADQQFTEPGFPNGAAAVIDGRYPVRIDIDTSDVVASLSQTCPGD